MAMILDTSVQTLGEQNSSDTKPWQRIRFGRQSMYQVAHPRVEVSEQFYSPQEQLDGWRIQDPFGCCCVAQMTVWTHGMNTNDYVAALQVERTI